MPVLRNRTSSSSLRNSRGRVMKSREQARCQATLAAIPSEAEDVDQVVDVRPGKIEALGGLGHIPVRLLERLAEQLRLETSRLFLKCQRVSLAPLALGGEVRENVRVLHVAQSFTGGAYDGGLDGVRELADIARPLCRLGSAKSIR